MQAFNSNGSRALWTRGFVVALWAIAAMALALGIWPAEAAPFAYVTDNGSNSVSVIDTATNTVMATVPVGNNPVGVAITPDGRYAYVANANSGTVSVIDMATNTVGATVAVGMVPKGSP